jgi:hypothetical protein
MLPNDSLEEERLKNKLRLKRRRYEKMSLQRKLSKTLQEAKQIAEERLIQVICSIPLRGCP